MWTSILQSLFQGLLSFVKDWFEEERAAANEWEAKARAHQIESMKEVRAQEMTIAKKVKETQAPANAAAWNALTKATVLLLLCLPLTGCFRFYVAAREAKVIIPEPERPVLPEEPVDWTEREQLLAEYATKLQAALQAYNEWAAQENEKYNLAPAPPSQQ